MTHSVRSVLLAGSSQKQTANKTRISNSLISHSFISNGSKVEEKFKRNLFILNNPK